MVPNDRSSTHWTKAVVFVMILKLEQFIVHQIPSICAKSDV